MERCYDLQKGFYEKGRVFSEEEMSGRGPAGDVSVSKKSALEANVAIHGFAFCTVQRIPDGLLVAQERDEGGEMNERIWPISDMFLVSGNVERTSPPDRQGSQ